MQKARRAMRRILKWSGITVMGLLALALLLFTVAFLINAHDEKLSPQARALLIPPGNPYAPEDNIYLALAGADAPPGQPVIESGVAKVSTYNQRVDRLIHNPTLPGEEAFTRMPEDPHRLEFKGDCNLVKPAQESLWQTIPPHREDIQKLLADNGELYRRYLALHQRYGYYETARPAAFAPLLPRWPVCERKLFLAEYVLRMRSGNLAEQRRALADLQDDVQLWRNIFEGEGTLVSKMVSVAYLQGDYLLLADAIADPHAAVPLDGSDADALVPVSDPKDWDLGSTFAVEYRVTSSFVRHIRTGRLVPPTDVPFFGMPGRVSCAFRRLPGKSSA